MSRIGQTQMTTAGVAYASLHQEATFTLLHLPQPAVGLGMEADATAVIEPTASGIQTTIVARSGGMEAWASRIEATTERGDWVRLEITEDSLGFGDFTRLMQRVDVVAEMLGWQWSDGLADAATDAVAAGVRAGQPTAVEMIGGDALGVLTQGSVECSETGACTLVTVFELG